MILELFLPHNTHKICGCQRAPSALPPRPSTPGTLDGHGHGGGVCVCVCGCPRPLHRWLQVQRHAWLITKGLQSSGRHSRPFLPRAGGGAGGGVGGAESRPGDGPWSSKESAGVKMSRFLLDYFCPSCVRPPFGFIRSVFCCCESVLFFKSFPVSCHQVV